MLDLTPDPILPPLPHAEYRALRDSVAELGVQVPLLVTSAGKIIDGHERHRACLELGLDRCPLPVRDPAGAPVRAADRDDVLACPGGQGEQEGRPRR